MTQENESFIDVDELAEYLKLKKRSTYHFIATQGIPHYRVGRLIRFKLSEIEAWMNNKKSDHLNVPYEKLEGI